MSKADSNKKWASEHRDEIHDYNRTYYQAKAEELRKKRKLKYNTDKAYREAAIERARNRRKMLAEQAEKEQPAVEAQQALEKSKTKKAKRQ